jgi:hypothetical protein
MNRTRRYGVVLTVVILVALAGCGGIFGSESPSTDERPSEIETSPTSPSTTASEDTTPGVSESQSFTVSSAVGEFLVRTSELPAGYVLDSKRLTTQPNASNESAAQFDEYNIQKLHERVFFRADEDITGSQLILSSALVFQSNQSAKEYVSTFSGSLREEATANSVTIGEGISAQQIRFKNERGLQNVVVIGRIDNLVVYITSSDPNTYYPDQTRSLFVNVYAEAQQQASETG